MLLIQKLLKIRAKQTIRTFSSMGIIRTIFVLLFLLPISLLFLREKIITYPYVIMGLIIGVLFIFHQQRKDTLFLLKISHRTFCIYLTEYLLITCPILILLLWDQLYLYSFILFVFLVIVSLTRPSFTFKHQHTYTAVIQYIPSELFEWKSGIRHNIFLIIPLYLIGLLGFFHLAFTAVSFALLFLITISFYSENEPRNIIEAKETSARNFLKNKIISHTKWLNIFIFPLLLVSMVHYESWPLILTVYIITHNTFIFSIVLKYVYYSPHSTRYMLNLINSLITITSFFPPVAVCLLLINPFLYLKAKKNLNHYLYDYD